MTTTDRAPVEVTTRYATTVPDLPGAWAFVMARVDLVGPSPRITITPIDILSDGLNDECWRTEFEVEVSGMIHESSTP